MKHCAFCENEAEYEINHQTPICSACKEVYECGQASPEAIIDELTSSKSIPKCPSCNGDRELSKTPGRYDCYFCGLTGRP